MWHLVPFLGLLGEASGSSAPVNASSTVPPVPPVIKFSAMNHTGSGASSSSIGVILNGNQLSSDPIKRTEELSSEMESWCAKIWDHNSEWGGYAVQRFEENEARAQTLGNALREAQAKQAAMYKLVPRDDPLAKMALQQSEDGKKVEEDIMKAKSGYLAARAARHQWKVVAEAITLVDKKGTITCNQEKELAKEQKTKFKEAALLQNGGATSKRFLLSKRQGSIESDPNAKEVALEHLKARKARLDKMIAWCAAQDAAAEAAKKAKQNMVTRTDFQKELHEEAIERIEEKVASFSEMCDSFVDDLKSFADVATSEKVSYAKLSESVPQGLQALLDVGHRAWMSWRKDIQESYSDLKDRCDKLKYIMEMRIVGRQEEIQALPDHEDMNQDGWPDVCPSDKELEAERTDIMEKIKEVNEWDDAVLDEAQKKAEGKSPPKALAEKGKTKKTVKKKSPSLWR